MARISSLTVAGLEDFEFAAQDHGHPKVALTSGEDDFAAAHDPPPAQRFQQRELPIVQLWKRDALRVTIKLLVFLGIVHGVR